MPRGIRNNIISTDYLFHLPDNNFELSVITNHLELLLINGWKYYTTNVNYYVYKLPYNVIGFRDQKA